MFRMDFPWRRMKLVANLMDSRETMIKLCQSTSLVQLGTWVMDKWQEMFGVSAEEVFEGVFSREYLDFENLQHHVVVMAGVAGKYNANQCQSMPINQSINQSINHHSPVLG